MSTSQLSAAATAGSGPRGVGPPAASGYLKEPGFPCESDGSNNKERVKNDSWGVAGCFYQRQSTRAAVGLVAAAESAGTFSARFAARLATTSTHRRWG